MYFIRRLNETSPQKILRIYTQDISATIHQLGVPRDTVLEMRGSIALDRAFCTTAKSHTLNLHKSIEHRIWKWRRRAENANQSNPPAHAHHSTPLGECPQCGDIIAPGIVFEDSASSFCDYRDFSECDLAIVIGEGASSMTSLIGGHHTRDSPCVVVNFVTKEEANFHEHAFNMDHFSSHTKEEMTEESRHDMLVESRHRSNRLDLYLYGTTLRSAFTKFTQHISWIHLPSEIWKQICFYLSDEDLCSMSCINSQFYLHSQNQLALRVCSYLYLRSDSIESLIIQKFGHCIHWRRVLIRLSHLIFLAKELQFASQLESNLDVAVSDMMDDIERISSPKSFWKTDIVYTALDSHVETPSLLSSLRMVSSMMTDLTAGSTSHSSVLFSPESMSSISTLQSTASLDETLSLNAPSLHLMPIAASSTLKSFHIEHATNSLDGTYWCSAPSLDSNSCEYLLFQFSCDLAFVNKLRFEVYENDGIIFAPKKVQFFMGYMREIHQHREKAPLNSDFEKILEEFSWCVSPELSFPPDTYFPIEYQLTSDLQMMGNFLCVKLIGKVRALDSSYLVTMKGLDVTGAVACEDIVSDVHDVSVVLHPGNDSFEVAQFLSLSPFIPPSEDERIDAIALMDMDVVQRKLFTPLDDFKPLMSSDDPMDWAFSMHHQQGEQTFLDFKREYHLMNTAGDVSQKIVCILPIGKFEIKSTPEKILEIATQFLPGVASRVLPVVPFGSWRDDFRVSLRHTRKNTMRKSARVRFRISPEGTRQVCADSLLAKFTPIPENALSLLIITDEEIYSLKDDEHGGIMQQTNVAGRVGVLSLSSLKRWRYRSESTFQRVEQLHFIKESAEMVLHEILHIQGMSECVFFQCLMNGFRTERDLEGRKCVLCPVCLRKVQYMIPLVDLARYTLVGGWKKFVAVHNAFEQELKWIGKRLNSLIKEGIDLEGEEE